MLSGYQYLARDAYIKSRMLNKMSGSHKVNTDDSKDDGPGKESLAENSDSTLAVTGANQFSTRSLFIPLPGAKSRIWKYFAFEADDYDRIQNNSIVFCQVLNCNTRIGYSKNTTNMPLHLKQHHSTQYSEMRTSSQQQ